MTSQEQPKDETAEELNVDQEISVSEESVEHIEESVEAEVAEDSSNDEIEGLKLENTQLKDKLLRIAAEMENVRKRTERDKQDSLKYGVSKFAKELLPVSDNLLRALEAAPEDLSDLPDGVANLVEGVKATRGELLQAMKKMGIAQIEATPGTKFDPNRHEVMFEAPSDDYNTGEITQVIEQGYMIHDRLLRPARVGVARKPDSSKSGDQEVDLEA